MNAIMYERDLYNFYFLASKYLHKAFSEGVRSEVYLANITGEVGVEHDRGVVGEPGECQAQAKGGSMKGAGNWEGGGLGAPLQSGGPVNELGKSRRCRDPPPDGGAIKTCIEDVLPEMTSRLAVIER